MLIADLTLSFDNTIAVVIVKEINDIFGIGVDISVVDVGIGCFSTATKKQRLSLVSSFYFEVKVLLLRF